MDGVSQRQQWYKGNSYARGDKPKRCWILVRFERVRGSKSSYFASIFNDALTMTRARTHAYPVFRRQALEIDGPFRGERV
jgi:hypothetical protein